MIGGILGLYLSGFLWNTVEDGLRAYSKGELYEHKGITGKILNKLSKGKIPENMGLKFLFDKAGEKTAMQTAMQFGARRLVDWFFNPYVIAAKTAVGMAYDARKEYVDTNLRKQILDLPTESDKYMIDERFNAISSNSFNSMERVNYTINELLNSGNIAGNMIDQVFKNM